MKFNVCLITVFTIILVSTEMPAQIIPLNNVCSSCGADGIYIDTSGVSGEDLLEISITEPERLYSNGPWGVLFHVNAISLPSLPADSTVEVGWQSIDTSQVTIRSGFQSIENRFGQFTLRKYYPQDTVGYLSQAFSLTFEDLVNIDSASRQFDTIDHVTASCDRGITRPTYIPDDVGLQPGLELDELLVGGTHTFWRRNQHKLGWQWNIYAAKLPMAWEITAGKPEVVIADRDCWHYNEDWGVDEPVSHPDLPVKDEPNENGNFIYVDANHLGDGTIPTWPLGIDHGIGVLSMAVARGDDGQGMTGTCYNCSGVALDMYAHRNPIAYNPSVHVDQFANIDTDLEDNNSIQRISVVNLSYGGGSELVEFGALIQRGVIVVASAANAITTDCKIDWGKLVSETITSSEIVRTFGPNNVSPADNVYTPLDTDPTKDYKIIAVGATSEMNSRNQNCDPFGTTGTTGGPIFDGPEHFVIGLTYSPDTNKFNTSGVGSDRIKAKQAAYMDLLAPTGFLLYASDGPSSCPDDDFTDTTCNRGIQPCSFVSEYGKYKYRPDGIGTSYAAPQVAGICGLMLSVSPFLGVGLNQFSGLPNDGADVQRRAYNILTFTADKIPDNGANLSEYICGHDSSLNKDIRVKFQPVINPNYTIQQNDHLKRAWAQRNGFGRVNAYRAVAHAIPLKANFSYNFSATLFANIVGAPQNEHGVRLIHFGAWKNIDSLVLDYGGVSIPGQSFRNQGVTKINGTGTVLTVPESSLVAIDGIMKTDDPLSHNRIVTSEDGRICMDGYLENVTLEGNVRLSDLIVNATASNAQGGILISDASHIGEVYGKVWLEGYSSIVVDKGVLRIKPGGSLGAGNNYSTVTITGGGQLILETASSAGSTLNGFVIESGSKIVVEEGASVDLYTNVIVKAGGELLIREGAKVNLGGFTVERGGTLTLEKGCHVALTTPNLSKCYGQFQSLGTGTQRVRLSGDLATCCETSCTAVDSRSRILVLDELNDVNDRTSCFMNLKYTDVDNVQIATQDAPLYPILYCTFVGNRSLLRAKDRPELLNIEAKASITSTPYDPNISYPRRDVARLVDCSFTDGDGALAGAPESSSYTLIGSRFKGMKRVTALNGEYSLLYSGIASDGCDSVGAYGNEVWACNFGLWDFGSAVGMCGNTMKRTEFGARLDGSKTSLFFGNTFDSTTNAYWPVSSALQLGRGNIFKDYSKFGVRADKTTVLLNETQVGKFGSTVEKFGRNEFSYSGGPLIFDQTPTPIDLGMGDANAWIVIACGYNKLAELSTYHLFSSVPKSIQVNANEFEDLFGFVVRKNPLVTSIGTPINVSASYIGCVRSTSGFYCHPTNYVEGNEIGADDINWRLVSDGHWTELSASEPFLDTAFYHARTTMLDTSISVQGRLIKAYDALQAAILGDSVIQKLHTLGDDYEDMAQSTYNADVLRSTSLRLRGEVYERLDDVPTAIESYEAITTNYPLLADSLPAAWRIQYLGLVGWDSLKVADSAGVAIADSLRGEYYARVLRDIRRQSSLYDPAPKRSMPDHGVTGVASVASLDQNIPNPFDDATTIHYRLSVAAGTRLYVTDALGKVVTEVDHGMKSAGEHEVTLSTSSLTPGLYFYHLEVKGQRITRQMILTR